MNPSSSNNKSGPSSERLKQAAQDGTILGGAILGGQTPLQAIFDHVEVVIGDGQADLKYIIESFGHKALGPVMLLCGLFMLTPLGALPMVPAAFGLIIINFSLQRLLRRPTPWLPNILRKVKISAKNIKAVKRRTRPILAKIDARLHPRWPWLLAAPFQILAALIAIILSLLLIPLSAIPFAVCIPGFVLGLIGLGLTAHDGAVLAAGFGVSIGAMLFIIALII